MNLADRDCWQFQVVEILFNSYLHIVSKAHWLEQQKQQEILKIDILFYVIKNIQLLNIHLIVLYYYATKHLKIFTLLDVISVYCSLYNAELKMQN